MIIRAVLKVSCVAAGAMEMSVSETKMMYPTGWGT